MISFVKEVNIIDIDGFNEEQNINIVKLTIDIIKKIMREELKYQEVSAGEYQKYYEMMYGNR